MESSQNNLLIRLHKWAARQGENFLTESFAFLLQHLLDNEPEASVRLVGLITNGFIQLRPEESKVLEVRTQVTFGEGTPDLQLRTARQLAFIEVKSDSELAPGQLRRYRRILLASGFPETMLGLLTRYPSPIEEGAERPDVSLRWYEVAEWIQVERQRYSFKPISSFLVEQFLGLLGAKNMVMGQVTWELSGGVRALYSLTNMLFEAATACGWKAQVSGGRDYMGVRLDGNSYWTGIYYDRPEILCFETNYAFIDKEAAQKLESGTVFEWESEEGKFGWRRELNLEAEDIHFFARSKASQLQLLEAFLRENLEIVKSIVLSSNGGEDSASDEE